MDYQCFYIGDNHWDGVPSVFVCIFLICIHTAFTVGGFHIVSPVYIVEEEKKSHRKRYEEESYFTLPLYKQVYLIGTKKYIAARYYIYSIIEFIANFSALLTFLYNHSSSFVFGSLSIFISNKYDSEWCFFDTQ